MKITQNQLIELLKEIKGVTMANITYIVDESKSRTIKGVKQVQKQVTVNITLNSNYENKVNKIATVKQNMEANFVAEELNGKVMIAPALLQSKKDAKFMLYGAIEHNAKRETIYYYKGEVKTVDQLRELDVLTPAFFERPATKGRGLVQEQNDFALVSPKIDTIKRITIKKINYEII